MATSKQACTLTHFRNAVPLVWGSLRPQLYQSTAAPPVGISKTVSFTKLLALRNYLAFCVRSTYLTLMCWTAVHSGSLLAFQDFSKIVQRVYSCFFFTHDKVFPWWTMIQHSVPGSLVISGNSLAIGKARPQRQKAKATIAAWGKRCYSIRAGDHLISDYCHIISIITPIWYTCTSCSKLQCKKLRYRMNLQVQVIHHLAIIQ